VKIAKICNEWDLPFNIDVKSEDSVSLHNRSYIHYAAQHTDLVAAKCWATKWLLKSVIQPDENYSVREYMAGIGVQTLLIQKLFKISKHNVGELDAGCVEHLLSTRWDCPITVDLEDAQKALEKNDESDLKFLDLPNSSILQITTKWKNGFDKMFESNPKLVVWTDTSVTYPMTIHGKKYGEILSAQVNDKYDYVNAYSNWLYNRFGYSIIRAAFRARNAVYFAAIPGKHETETKEFPVADNLDGFYFMGEEKSTLDNFF
jgi:hypothetical protein